MVITGRPKYLFFKKQELNILQYVEEGKDFFIKTQRGDPGVNRGVIYLNNLKKNQTCSLQISTVQLDETVIVPFKSEEQIGYKSYSLIPNIDGTYTLDLKWNKIICFPSIGSISLAPKTYNSTNPGKYGGNFDCKYLTSNCKIYLKAFIDGGLLAAGDLHAHIADGEILGSAIEATGFVKLNYEIELRGIKSPIIETSSDIISVGYGKTVREAINVARIGLTHYLKFFKKLPQKEVNFYVNSLSDIRLGAVWPLIYGIDSEERITVYFKLSVKNFDYENPLF